MISFGKCEPNSHVFGFRNRVLKLVVSYVSNADFFLQVFQDSFLLATPCQDLVVTFSSKGFVDAKVVDSSFFFRVKKGTFLVAIIPLTNSSSIVGILRQFGRKRVRLGHMPSFWNYTYWKWTLVYKWRETLPSFCDQSTASPEGIEETGDGEGEYSNNWRYYHWFKDSFWRKWMDFNTYLKACKFTRICHEMGERIRDNSRGNKWCTIDV